MSESYIKDPRHLPYPGLRGEVCAVQTQGGDPESNAECGIPDGAAGMGYWAFCCGQCQLKGGDVYIRKGHLAKSTDNLVPFDVGVRGNPLESGLPALISEVEQGVLDVMDEGC